MPLTDPATWSPSRLLVAVDDEFGGRPVEFVLAETLDGLYTPYALRVPEGSGPYPFVFVAYGNGGGGMAWLRDRSRRYRYVTDRLREAGYAWPWARSRPDAELG